MTTVLTHAPPLAEAEPPRRLGAELLWEGLIREGVDTVFGYPGGAIMPAYDAMSRYPIHHVLVRHEQGAAHMADGYARASGRVGVAIATSGPGATNLVTGIATAMLDSVPMVAITGQVPSALIGSDAFQETDITGVTLPITKHNYLVTSADEILPTLAEAFFLARSGRPGPVVIDITKDAQLQTAPLEWPQTPPRLPGYRPSRLASAGELAEAAELIRAAQRPLILAGQGIIAAGATAALEAFVDRTDIPVACTLLGLGGFPASDPHHLGMLGMHGEAWVNQAVQQSDLVIALGMRFDDRVTGNLATFAPRAKKIHVELDPAEINKNVKVDVPIVGDVRSVLERLNTLASPRECLAWRGWIESRKSESSPQKEAELKDSGQLTAPAVIDALWRQTHGEALIVTDVGQHQMWEAQFYHHEHPRGLLTSGGLGTMGFALPAAIGARFARAEAPIWVIAGDGGFQMTACELSTVAQEKLDIKIAVINNGYLGMVRQWQELFYEGRYVATPIGSPDFVKLAEAHGIPGLRIESRSDLEDGLTRACTHRGPLLVEFRVTAEDNVYPMVPAGNDLDDMLQRPRLEEEAHPS